MVNVKKKKKTKTKKLVVLVCPLVVLVVLSVGLFITDRESSALAHFLLQASVLK